MAATDTSRLTVNLSDSEHLQVAELARRAQTSVSQIGRLAIKHLLLKSDEALPLLPPVDLDSIPLSPWESAYSAGD